ncbi:hypothetical protein WA026_002030 [Henosepilachna vigintioctopunctata]|uniref:RHD domain-containing protein n=1 Tax=Henosepilachna vigintioctopunctata TaxID=420089 RepID=A0AAW1UTH9_9CUCU
MATTSYENNQSLMNAYVKIIEQPAPIVRFRYESEEKNSGLLQGASSTSDTKTFPSIQVVGYKGKAAVLVSLVTAEEPHRPHPHSLVGQGCCNAGVAFLPISPETMAIEFRNFKIRCVKKNEINEVLKRRKSKNIDPFKTGFSYPSPIDTTKVRLCFQVLLEGTEKGKFNVPLKPVVSQPIVDKRNKPDLVIVELSDCVSYADGDSKKIILLCEKIVKDDDIQVRFYEEKNGKVVWEGFGEFQPNRVHKHVAISFHPPRYHDLEISDPVNVFVQMRRPSDGATSESLPFQFKPSVGNCRKRRRLSNCVNLKKQLGVDDYSNTEYSNYEARRPSHTTMDMEEDVKGIRALSREPEPHEGVTDAPFESLKPETSYYVGQEENMTKQKSYTNNNPPYTHVPEISTQFQQSTQPNTPQNIQWSQIPTRRDSLPMTSVNQTNAQNTATTNIVQPIPSISVDPNESQNSHIDPCNGASNNTFNFNHLIQPNLLNFQNNPSAISQIAQVVIQNIPYIISQMTQSSLQNTPLSINMENQTGTEFIRRGSDTNSPSITSTTTSPPINLQDGSLQNSPSTMNSPIQFVFQNTPTAENHQVVSPMMNATTQVASPNTHIPAYSQAVVESPNWNIPFASLKEDYAQSEAKTCQNELRDIIQNINGNSELEPIKLNSGELGTYDETAELNNLSEVLSINLSLTDVNERSDQNMSDSLTRFINSTADNICQETNKFW